MSIGIKPYGEMSIESLYGAETLQNIGRHSNRWQIIEALLRIAEGNADRIAAGPSGVILMIGIPGRPNTGAFYFYDESTRHIFTITFEGQDTFHSLNFDIVMMTYDLHRLIDIAVNQQVKNSSKRKPSSPRAWYKNRRHQGKANSVGRTNAHTLYSKATGNQSVEARA